MVELPGRRKLGVVGDDLQGSNFSGAHLTACRLRTVVAPLERAGAGLEAADVPVINTASRLKDPQDAYERVREACRKLLALGCTHLYKFSDSAARGHLGVEADAVMDELGVERAAFALAQPSGRRLTVGGYHLDDGRPVGDSSTGRDLLQPVSQSYLPSLLASQSRRSVGLVPLDTVEKGPEAVSDALQVAREELMVVDAAAQHHLAEIARALVLAGMDKAIFGSAGLLGELPSALGLDCRPHRPVLVLCGSANPVAAAQVRALVDSGRAELVRLQAAELVGAVQTLPSGTETVLRSLRAGRNVAVMVEGYKPPRADEVAKLAEMVGSALASIAREAVANADLMMFGGDTAQRVLEELGIDALEVLAEVPVGAVLCQVIGGPLAGRRIMTKSGSGGGVHALLEAVQLLRNQPELGWFPVRNLK